ncbi:unnamed protein product [Parnassius mnemosyne]|uniref:Enhancer of mRNA-decapping protein 4 WD40 repeat region domain-containing protein n=1 Tax=Parnassius mnemosyne TaxID=213953 RepID=A0AAV1M995_9NEOP
MQPTTMLPKLSDTTQTISFSEGDGVCSSEVYASDVIVTTNAGSHNHGSSKVKLKNLVDYNWEPKFYPGQLLAVHISGKYLAYSIKAPNPANPGTWNGMVRVVYNPEPGTDRRTLIKGMKGEVQDLAFAHIQNQVVLACIDELGNFYVHEIESTENGLNVKLVLEVREDTGIDGTTHRVVWCPYIPDEDDDAPDDDVARLLLTTHGNVARMWNVRAVCAGAGGGAVGAAGALAGRGARAAGEHAAPVLAAAFSPDGTALATAAADGYVMFFQVRTLWRPRGASTRRPCWRPPSRPTAPRSPPPPRTATSCSSRYVLCGALAARARGARAGGRLLARRHRARHRRRGRLRHVLPGTYSVAPSRREHAAPVLAAAFSPDGTALATAAADGYVMFFQVRTLWRPRGASTRRPCWRPPSRPTAPRSPPPPRTATSCSSRYVLCGALAARARGARAGGRLLARRHRARHRRRGRLRHVLPGTYSVAPSRREHAAPVLAAAFSPDGTALATAAADGYVMFFQVRTLWRPRGASTRRPCWRPPSRPTAPRSPPPPRTATSCSSRYVLCGALAARARGARAGGRF